jgi:hypothetical protein
VQESAVDRKLLQKVRRADTVKLSVGLSVGLAVLLSGIILVTSGGFGSLGLLATGLLFLPLGLWISASVALGGLGPSYRFLSYRYLWFWGWIGSRDKEEEGSEKAESLEASEENDKTEEERRKSSFD